MGGQSQQSRFLEIVGFMMVCMRSQHSATEERAWPQLSPEQSANIEHFANATAEKIEAGTFDHKELIDNMTNAGKAEQEIECNGKRCPFAAAMALLDEAEGLQHSAGLPAAARLWVLAIRARLLCIGKQFEAAGPVCEEIARVAVDDPSAMQDPFSLYACYSVAFALQSLEQSGGAFVNL